MGPADLPHSTAFVVARAADFGSVPPPVVAAVVAVAVSVAAVAAAAEAAIVTELHKRLSQHL